MAVVSLVPLSTRHLANVAEVLSHPEVAIPANFPHPLDLDFLRRWVADRCARHRVGDILTYGILADRLLVGSCSLLWLPRERDRAEIAFWLAESHWDRGIGTEAARRLIGFGFARCGLTHLFARTDRDNYASARLLRKLGFELLQDDPAADTPAGYPVDRYMLRADNASDPVAGMRLRGRSPRTVGYRVDGLL